MSPLLPELGKRIQAAHSTNLSPSDHGDFHALKSVMGKRVLLSVSFERSQIEKLRTEM